MDTGTIALLISMIALLIVSAIAAANMIRKRKETEVLPQRNETGDSSDLFVVDQTLQEKQSDISSALSDAVSFELTSALKSDEEAPGLLFSKADVSETKNYKEIVLNETSRLSGTGISTGSIIGQQVFTIHQLAAQAPNGLFTATTNPGELTKFADGTFSTMVHGSKGIDAHYGYQQLQGVSMFNPAMLINVSMQAMAFVSGQYYLQNIYNRMNGLDSKVNELLLIQKAEKIGDLVNGWKTLTKIVKREVVDFQDIIRVERIIDEAGGIREQYYCLAEDQYRKLMYFSGSGGNAESRLKEYQAEIGKLQEYLEICFTAEQLKLKAETAEIVVRRNINIHDPKIPELLKELKTDIDDSFSINTYNNFDDYSSPILDRADALSSKHRGLRKTLKCLITDKNVVSEELTEPIRDEVSKMSDSLNLLVETSIYRQILSSDQEKRELLYIPGDENHEQRIFLEVNDDIDQDTERG